MQMSVRVRCEAQEARHGGPCPPLDTGAVKRSGAAVTVAGSSRRPNLVLAVPSAALFQM